MCQKALPQLLSEMNAAHCLHNIRLNATAETTIKDLCRNTLKSSELATVVGHSHLNTKQNVEAREKNKSKFKNQKSPVPVAARFLLSTKPSADETEESQNLFNSRQSPVPVAARCHLSTKPSADETEESQNLFNSRQSPVPVAARCHLSTKPSAGGEEESQNQYQCQFKNQKRSEERR